VLFFFSKVIQIRFWQPSSTALRLIDTLEEMDAVGDVPNIDAVAVLVDADDCVRPQRAGRGARDKGRGGTGAT